MKKLFAKLRSYFALSSLSALLALSPQKTHAADCSDSGVAGKAACAAAIGGVVVVGTAVGIFSMLTSLFKSSVDVKVELADGKIIDGKVKPGALTDRKINAGQTVKLICTERVAGSGVPFLGCDLHFPKLGPADGQAEVYDGSNSSIQHMSISKDGVPSDSYIELERKLVWADGKAV